MKISMQDEEEIAYVQRASGDEQITDFSHVHLYYKPGCPFCTRILDYLKKIGKTIPTKNIEEHPDAKRELVAIGGKLQVPCLIIDGKALYESLDIIRWLSEKKELICNR